ncbi:MAG: DUF3299 domain-containing protein [Pseudomonadota bacterium]
MFSIALRVVGVAAVVAVVAVLVMQPWAPEAAQPLTGADGAPIADDGTFRPVPGFDTSAPHELVRYQMPVPKEVPALAEGVAALSWEDLWQDGTYEPPTINGMRLGTPTDTEFPDGSTKKDIEMFFLDLNDMRSLQPLIGTIKPELDGKRVRIAGYTTPVGFGEDETGFLLVPELGACIHVPPPPPNQIVLVNEAKGSPEMFAPVWVEGTLRADPVATILADVGYRLEDVTAVPYK